AELLNRYLHCYGPSSAAHFAEWCGISRADAARSLDAADTAQLAKGVYLLTDDLGRYESPPQASGVRLLPPRDPYLLDRDRDTLVPERDLQRRIWRATPTDGLVLAAGVPVATWRPRKTNKHLRINVQPFTRLTRSAMAELDREVGAIASLR